MLIHLNPLNQFPSPKTEMESRAAKIGRTVYLYEVPSADRWNDHAAGFKSITRPLFKSKRFSMATRLH